MSLTKGFHAVAPGQLATIVTHLEMAARPQLLGPVFPAGLEATRVAAPETHWYRDLFRRVGGDWLWTSRLEMAEAALAEILSDPAVEIWVLRAGAHDEALLELDFRSHRECELAFLGLSAALQGQGLGRQLMALAMARAWARPIDRFWVHTCTHDHPAALGFYRRVGFRPVRSEVEVIDDPRLTGVLPQTAAPHIPIYGSAMDAAPDRR
ncbi:MAG: GNAT family N-acetyltransferase [Pseudomonadota bacterium]